VRKLGRLRTFEPVARQLNDSSHSPESTSVERQMRSSGSTDTRIFRGNLGWQSKNGRAVAKDLDESRKFQNLSKYKTSSRSVFSRAERRFEPARVGELRSKQTLKYMS